MPECYIIAGANGSGKTTFAREFLPRFANCINFINPDLIAAGFSPFDPELAMTKAARMVLAEIALRVAHQEDFAFETTLSGRGYLGRIREMRRKGYSSHMFYLWLPTAELALERIHDRVENGGHNVPEADVRRRYSRTLHNLFTLFRPNVDTLHFFDNSTDEPRLVFHDDHGNVTVSDQALYDRLLSYGDCP